MCFKTNDINTVKILVNYAVLVESVEQENPAVLGEILLGNIRMIQSEEIYPNLHHTYI
jgi:hypothetical protein